MPFVPVLCTVVKGGNGIPVSPWIEPANSTWYPSKTSLMAHSPLYQEMLLHMAMAGVKRFLWFRCARTYMLSRAMQTDLDYSRIFRRGALELSKPMACVILRKQLEWRFAARGWNGLLAALWDP